jgi:hypothetical protein
MKPANYGVTVQQVLDARADLRCELTVLRGKAKKEKQINRRVELNLKIKRQEAELAKAKRQL